MTAPFSALAPSDVAALARLWLADPAAPVKTIRARFRRETGRTIGYSTAHKHRPEGAGRRRVDPARLAAAGLSGLELEAARRLALASGATTPETRREHLWQAGKIIREALKGGPTT